MEDIGHIPVCVRVEDPTINCSLNFPVTIYVSVTQGIIYIVHDYEN